MNNKNHPLDRTSNISEEVLKTIKTKKINPKPKWEFLLKDYSIWLISVLSLVIGSLAFSVIIFLVKNNDWDVYEHINNSLLEFAILSLPYFWIVFLVFFIITAHYNFKHTKKGYKYQLHTIIISSIIISILLGTFLYNFGAGYTIDRVLAQKMPFYQKFTQDPRNRWMQPDKGLLAGEIVAIDEQGIFLAKDMSGKTWQIISKEASLNGGSKIKIGDLVRMIGQQFDNALISSTSSTSSPQASSLLGSCFQAKRILPARPLIIRRFRNYILEEDLKYFKKIQLIERSLDK